MKKIAIVTDSNSGITPKEARQLGIFMVPMPICVNGRSYLEWKNYTPKEFFADLEQGVEVFTSQPAPGEVVLLWRKILKKYDELVYIPMSSGLSNSCQTAKAIALEFPGKVFVADIKRISLTQQQAVLDACKLAEAGLSAAEIRETLERESMNASIYVAVNTLELLKKSGRVTPAGAAVAAVLGLKPVLKIQGEKLDAFKKARGMPKARELMIAALREDLKTRFPGESMAVGAAYSGDPEEGKRWHEEVQAAFPELEVGMAMLPLSICCHVGAGAMGIACSKKL